MTEWRKIPGLPERFEASEYGEIRSLAYEVKVFRKDGTVRSRPIDGRVLLPRAYDGGKSNGHPVVTIASLNTSGKKLGEQRVSVLVARAFHGCPYEPGDPGGKNKWRILHLDGDITNVAANNLEWVTSNGSSTNTAAYKLYCENLRKLEQQRNEPAIIWARRIFGEDVELEECV